MRGVLPDICRTTTHVSWRRQLFPPTSFFRPRRVAVASRAWAGKNNTVFCGPLAAVCRRRNMETGTRDLCAIYHILSARHSAGRPFAEAPRRLKNIKLTGKALRSAAYGSPSPDAAPEGADTLAGGKKKESGCWMPPHPGKGCAGELNKKCSGKWSDAPHR